jgi:hypothetical protein
LKMVCESTFLFSQIGAGGYPPCFSVRMAQVVVGEGDGGKGVLYVRKFGVQGWWGSGARRDGFAEADGCGAGNAARLDGSDKAERYPFHLR